MLHYTMFSDAASSAGAKPTAFADDKPFGTQSSSKDDGGRKEDDTDTLGVLVAAYERDLENDRRNSLPTERK